MNRSKMPARIATALVVALSVSPSDSARAQYNPLTDHVQHLPHTKVMMLDYLPPGWNSIAKDPEVLQFMATHYDAFIGGHDMTPFTTANKPPQFMYVNYYCTYVGQDEYLDAQNWAAANRVDFESFFIHYKSPTRACFGSACFDLPAGSRVPTYNWYGSNGDLTRSGARVVLNVGNPNYRRWRLDYCARKFDATPFFDGVMIDNVAFNQVGVKIPTTPTGGDFAEYPHVAGGNAGADYGDDVVTMIMEFKGRFGTGKMQVPNVSSASEDPRIYPYVWGLFREMTLQPAKALSLPGIARRIAESGASGVRNLMGSVVFQERHAIAGLALYYLLKADSTYFFPIRNDIADFYGADPRKNQWFGAVAYDVGQPLTDPPTNEKYFTFARGIDPASSEKTTMHVLTVTKSGETFRLEDPAQNWTAEQWKGKKVVFPSGLTKPVYHSGPNWISVWAPEEVPTAGTYHVGNYSYMVLGREYERALVLFRPLGDSYKSDDSTAATIALPATARNPQGQYLILNANGTVNPAPVSAVTLRGTEGAILIHASSFKAPTGLRTRP